MTTNSIPDDPLRIHLRNWLLASDDPLCDLSLLDRGFSRQATEPPQCTAQIVTPSAALRELLTRCLRALDLTAAETDDPALVLLDLAAPDALTYCRTLREPHPDQLICGGLTFSRKPYSGLIAGVAARSARNSTRGVRIP